MKTTGRGRYPDHGRVTLMVTPDNKSKLRKLGGAAWLRHQLDLLAEAPKPDHPGKRVAICVRMTPEQHVTWLRLGGAPFLDALIEQAPLKNKLKIKVAGVESR